MPDQPTRNQAALLNALAMPGALLYHPRDAVYSVVLPGVPKPLLYTTKQCFRACLRRYWIIATTPGADTYRLTSDGKIARGRL